MNEDELFRAYEGFRGSLWRSGETEMSITVGRRQAFKISVLTIWNLVRHPRTRFVKISMSDDA